MKVATSGQRIVYPPIGIMYLAAVLEKEGFEVKILDCQTEGLDREAILKDGYVEVGIPNEEIRQAIRGFAPDCVGISCNFSVMVAGMKEVARIAKEEFPDSIVIAGGNHPTCMPEEVMEDKNFDFIIRGEGEISFPLFLKTLAEEGDLNKVPSLVWRLGDRVKINAQGELIKDLDSLPWPAWHLFPFEKYSKHYRPNTVTWGEPVAMPSILTTRGCAGTCVFCSVHKTMGRKFRARKLDEVFKEIRFLKEKYNISKIMIIDDNFTHNKNRAKEFCDRFIEENLGIEVNFMVLALWCMDEELIDKLAEIGYTHLGFALESGVQEVLTKIIKKPLKLDRAMELLRYAKSKGLHITGTFVIGFPGETKKDIMRSLYMANYSGLFDSREIYIATPLPGSEMYETCDREGLFADDFTYDRVEVVKANISTNDFTPEDIEVILEADRTHHLIKSQPKRIFKHVSNVKKRKGKLFLPVMKETAKMFIKYDFLRMKEVYP